MLKRTKSKVLSGRSSALFSAVKRSTFASRAGIGVALRDLVLRIAEVGRVVVRNDAALRADDVREDLGVVAARRIQVEHGHAGLHAEEGDHLGGLAVRVLREVLGQAVGRGERGRDRVARGGGCRRRSVLPARRGSRGFVRGRARLRAGGEQSGEQQYRQRAHRQSPGRKNACQPRRRLRRYQARRRTFGTRRFTQRTARNEHAERRWRRPLRGAASLTRYRRRCRTVSVRRRSGSPRVCSLQRLLEVRILHSDPVAELRRDLAWLRDPGS